MNTAAKLSPRSFICRKEWKYVGKFFFLSSLSVSHFYDLLDCNNGATSNATRGEALVWKEHAFACHTHEGAAVVCHSLIRHPRIINSSAVLPRQLRGNTAEKKRRRQKIDKMRPQHWSNRLTASFLSPARNFQLSLAFFLSSSLRRAVKYWITFHSRRVAI